MTLKCSAELRGLGAMLERGPSDERQCHAYERTHRLEAAAEALERVFETDQPVSAGP